MIANLAVLDHMRSIKDLQTQQRWALIQTCDVVGALSLDPSATGGIVQEGKKLFPSCRYVPSMVLLLNTHRNAQGHLEVDFEKAAQFIAPLAEEAQSTLRRLDHEIMMPAIARFMGMTLEQTRDWSAGQIDGYRARGLSGVQAPLAFWGDMLFLMRHWSGKRGLDAIGNIATGIGGDAVRDLHTRVAKVFGISATDAQQFRARFAEKILP